MHDVTTLMTNQITALVRINTTEQLLAQLHVVEGLYGLIPVGVDFLVLRT